MARFLATVFCALALAACGGAGDNDSDGDSAARTWKDSYPKCDDIWKVGKTLPANYENGCVSGDETLLDNVYTACADDNTRMFVHRSTTGKSTHVAITGSQIQAYSVDAMLKAYDVCQPSPGR